MTLRALWGAAVAACCLACLNVAILVLVPSYDLHIGPLHLVAHQLFKPLLIAGFAFWIVAFLKGFLIGPAAAAPLSIRALVLGAPGDLSGLRRDLHLVRGH